MSFNSILFGEQSSVRPLQTGSDPAYFRDLNLDQFFDAVLAGQDEYDLRVFFRQPLLTLDEITHRQEVMRELETDSIRSVVESFAHDMQDVRNLLQTSEKLYYSLQKRRYFLQAAELYVRAVETLAHGLDGVSLASHGLRDFRAYVHQYVDAREFRTLVSSTREVLAQLGTIEYSVTVYGGSLRVREYEEAEDYSAIILQVFDKFRQADAPSHLADIPDYVEMNHVEAQILDFVAKLNPEAFAALEVFASSQAAFRDDVLVRFDREVQFYLSYLRVVRRIAASGIDFCYPTMSDTKDVSANGAFDVALAEKLRAEGKPLVTNDFYLSGNERILLVSGPNQGGKTTFARTFGQMHFLASLGCKVPGSAARLFLFDQVFTHFEREEHAQDLRGKLEDELVRVHEILGKATSSSIVIMNEIFASTTLEDATFLAHRILRQIIRLDLLCVCVTFLDELLSLGPTLVSMVTRVVPERPTERTFKIERQEPDGRSYAMSLAEKYRLTARQLEERLARAA